MGLVVDPREVQRLLQTVRVVPHDHRQEGRRQGDERAHQGQSTHQAPTVVRRSLAKWSEVSQKYDEPLDREDDLGSQEIHMSKVHRQGGGVNGHRLGPFIVDR